MDIESKLEEESIRLLGKLSELDPETDEYKAVLSEFSQLTGRDIEYKRLALDTTEKARASELANRKANLEVTDRTEGRLIEREKLKYEHQRLEVDAKETRAAREQDAKLRRVQMRDDRIDKYSRTCTDLVKHGSMLALGICLAKAVFTYEEKGTISSILGRKILGMFLPNLKW